jgi:hypothetical protein
MDGEGVDAAQVHNPPKANRREHGLAHQQRPAEHGNGNGNTTRIRSRPSHRRIASAIGYLARIGNSPGGGHVDEDGFPIPATRAQLDQPMPRRTDAAPEVSRDCSLAAATVAGLGERNGTEQASKSTGARRHAHEMRRRPAGSRAPVHAHARHILTDAPR